MKNTLKQLICIVLLLNSCTTSKQKVDHKLETTFMNCIYSSLLDNGVELITILKKAEQILIEEKLLKDTSGESYIALYKNIETIVDGNVSNFGISNHVISAVQVEMIQIKVLECRQAIISSVSLEDGKVFTGHFTLKR